MPINLFESKFRAPILISMDTKKISPIKSMFVRDKNLKDVSSITTIKYIDKNGFPRAYSIYNTKDSYAMVDNFNKKKSPKLYNNEKNKDKSGMLNFVKTFFKNMFKHK